MFRVHRVGANNLSVRNLILLFFTIVLGFASVITLADISIPSDIANAWQTIARISITADGMDGTALIDMSSGGITIDPSILSGQTIFSGNILGIDDNGNLVYTPTQGLVISGGGNELWTSTGNDIYRYTGNVGIGTDNPTQKFHIVNSGSTDVYIEETAAGMAANLNLKNPARTWAIGGDSIPDIFYIGQAGGAFDFAITSSGYIGIGTTGPKAELQVVGSFIAGDYSNNIHGNTVPSSILGGSGNSISGSAYAVIGGGRDNKIDAGSESFLGAGYSNNIHSSRSFIGAGEYIDITSGSIAASVVGGYNNNIYGGNYSAIVGGYVNTIESSTKSFIGGGDHNYILNSDFSTIPGGYDNSIKNSPYSFAAGYGAQANDENVFIRNSDINNPFISAKPGSFLINVPIDDSPSGGVGINTPNPQTELDVNGNIFGHSIKLSTDNAGMMCTTSNKGRIILSGDNFVGCNGSGRKQLDNL